MLSEQKVEAEANYCLILFLREIAGEWGAP